MGTFAGLALYLALSARPIAAADGFPLDIAAPFSWTPFAIAMRVSLLFALTAAVMGLVGALTQYRPARGSSCLPAAVWPSHWPG